MHLRGRAQVRCKRAGGGGRAAEARGSCPRWPQPSQAVPELAPGTGGLLPHGRPPNRPGRGRKAATRAQQVGRFPRKPDHPLSRHLSGSLIARLNNIIMKSEQGKRILAAVETLIKKKLLRSQSSPPCTLSKVLRKHPAHRMFFRGNCSRQKSRSQRQLSRWLCPQGWGCACFGGRGRGWGVAVPAGA